MQNVIRELPGCAPQAAVTNEQTSLWGAFSSSFGSNEVNNYGGEIGLRVSFFKFL